MSSMDVIRGPGWRVALGGDVVLIYIELFLQ